MALDAPGDGLAGPGALDAEMRHVVPVLPVKLGFLISRRIIVMMRIDQFACCCAGGLCRAAERSGRADCCGAGEELPP